MRLSWKAFLPSLLVWSAMTALAPDDETVADAYDAILRGDYRTGEALIARLEKSPSAEIERLRNWLTSFREVVDGRDELRAKTFQWNLNHAMEALEQDKVYLALTFAAQAAPHAKDADAYSAEPWIATLTERALAEASERAKAHSWTKVVSYYRLLARIHPDDKQLEDLFEKAMRHARLEILYADVEAVERRIEGVSYKLLSAVVRQISKHYYNKPDFKKLGEGALDYLDAICATHKLFDVFDGLGNPVLRAEFQKGLSGQRRELAEKERVSYKDLLRLYVSIGQLNKRSVELPEGLLIMEFLEGALERLDKFTSMIWPVNARDFDKMMRGDFEGVGIQLGVDARTGRLNVVTPLENSPALEAGIRAGDVIDKVDGVSTKGWTTDDAIREITGPGGTIVDLTMFRPSTGKRITFPLKRRKILLTTVRGVNRTESAGWNFMLDRKEGIACVRLTGFNPDSLRELTNALNDAKSQGMKGLILDLRYNPGGLLDVARGAVSMFLKEGTVLSTRGRTEAPQHFKIEEEADFGDLPLVILVNNGSASASEILAGALQYHERAIVLGERTFGKGSVQRVLPIGKRARLKLTTALYYLPSGRSPHRKPDAKLWGIDPDWEVKLTPKEIRKVLEAENRSNIIRNGEAGDEPGMETVDEKTLAELKEDEPEEDPDAEAPLLTEADIKLLDSDPYEAPNSDPQLETALLLIRTKLAGKLPWPPRVAARMPEKMAP